MPEYVQVLDKFKQRLLAGITRSPLLKSTVSRTGRLLDCHRLETATEGLCQKLVRSIVDNGSAVRIDLSLRLPGLNAGTEDSQEEQDELVAEPLRQAREHRAIYHSLERMRRRGELVSRETGVHSLWLGYPLLYVVTGEADSQQWILAPAFLWPITIRPDLRVEGRIVVSRARNAGEPRFNRVMAGWVQRQLNLQLQSPDEDDLEKLHWPELQAHLRCLAKQFRDSPHIDCEAPLEPIPNAKLLSPQQNPRFFNSAVLGVFRGQHDALVLDIDALKGMDRVEGICSGYVSPTETKPIVCGVSERPPEHDRYQVYDADFSQERVIWNARNDDGLVVHGPPGTGKSQTIVNIIADALAHRRTVLMVCQKHAATQVVLERLKQVGLDQLCVEVSDTDKSRGTVFRAIRDQVDAIPQEPDTSSTRTRERFARKIAQIESELDHFACAMHEQLPKIGRSYRQIKSMEGEAYSKCSTVRELQALTSLLADSSIADLEAILPEIEQAGRLFAIGQPHTNPWRFQQSTVQLSSHFESDIADLIAQLRYLDARHLESIDGAEGFEISGDVDVFAELSGELLQRLEQERTGGLTPDRSLFRAWLRQIRAATPDAIVQFRHRCEEASRLADRVVATPLDPHFSQRYDTLARSTFERVCRAADIVLSYQNSWWRFLSTRFRSAQRVVAEVEPLSNGTAIWTIASGVVRHREALSMRSQMAALNRSLVSPITPEAVEERQLAYPRRALSELQFAERLCAAEFREPWLKQVLDELCSLDPGSDDNVLVLLRRSQKRFRPLRDLLAVLDRFRQYLTVDGYVEPEELARSGRSIAEWLDAVERGIRGLRELQSWTLRKEMREPLSALLISALEDYERRRAAGEHVPEAPAGLPAADYGQWWGALVQYSACVVWQAAAHRSRPVLVEMTPEVHAAKVRELKELAQKKRNLEVAAIQACWHAEQSQYRNMPWKRMFQLKQSSRGNSKRLREAVHASLDRGLLAMRPCWLMNPTTVSEVFPLKSGLFDLVIFDEASQCPIEQAVPAIYRGESLVVSGDEMQLPPTDFFSSSTPGDDEADESSDAAASDSPTTDGALTRLNVNFLLNVEDLLKASIGYLRECNLLVHYRSRDPALIQFSNRAFYGGCLEVPPISRRSENEGVPIQYHWVGGTYERRTNREEAVRVVALLKDIWSKRGSAPTIGVVTFNRPQRDLIEDLIDEECHRDSAFRFHFEEELARREDNQDVGFFVKNLENVQGDERDVMIFSTTFGRDKEGRFARRFGPVGAEEGHRRLNVAVTRAKCRVIVVSSMPISEVSSALSASSAPGSQLSPAAYLQLYLAYAKAVSDADEDGVRRILQRLSVRAGELTTATPESPFEEDVQRVLEGLGLTVHSQIGESGFRIDLAVVAADPAHGYLLGIECDGATYHSDRSARLRDVWRAEILRARGWELYRIWSTRWWYYRGEEIEKLKLAIEDAQERLARRGESAVSAASEEQPAPLRESWEMTLEEWKILRDALRERGDDVGLRTIGGLGTDFAHRYRVAEALKQGKTVPLQVLADYPDLDPLDKGHQLRLFTE